MDFLECKICHVPYDEEDHRPRNAQCGHELCTDCLKALIKDGAFECPKCRQKNLVYLPEDLPVCFALIDIIRAFKDRNIPLVKETAPIVSGATNEEVCEIHCKALEHWCCKCQIWICIKCLESHTSMVGCSTTTSTKALDDMKVKQLRNIDMLLSSFEDDTKFMSSKIKKLNDKKKEALDKRQELLEQAEKYGEEVDELCNALEQGNIHKENLVESRNNLDTSTSPHTFSVRNKVATQRRKLLHTWCVKTLGTDTQIGLLTALKEDKEVFAELVIKEEKMHAKLSQQDERINIHTFRKQMVSEDCIRWPFGRLHKMIPSEVSLAFIDLSLEGTMKGRVFIRLDLKIPNIRKNIEDIVTGQKGPTLAGIRMDGFDSNEITASSLPFSEMKVTIDSKETSKAKIGDVLGYFPNGYLNKISVFAKAPPEGSTYNDNFHVLGRVEGGMDVIQVCHDKHSIGVTISDCGVVIEQD